MHYHMLIEIGALRLLLVLAIVSGSLGLLRVLVEGVLGSMVEGWWRVLGGWRRVVILFIVVVGWRL